MRITAPVCRSLEVADVARSVAFYREVLGFEAGPGAEVACGPASVRLVATAKPRRAVVHFEVNDVATAREAVLARGGAPSEIADANWIKVRLFEVRDPDGNVLFFGRSFAEPDVARPRGQLRVIMPGLPLADVGAGVAHYRDVLGFSVNHAQDDIAVMDRDDVRLLLVAKTERMRGPGSCYVYVEDADALHAELVAKGAHVKGRPVSRPWGLREFTVSDQEGNEITFGQPFE